MSEIISLIRRFNKAKSKFHGNVDERIWLVGEIGKLLKKKESALQKARAKALGKCAKLAESVACACASDQWGAGEHFEYCARSIAKAIRNLAAREKDKNA